MIANVTIPDQAASDYSRDKSVIIFDENNPTSVVKPSPPSQSSINLITKPEYNPPSDKNQEQVNQN